MGKYEQSKLSRSLRKLQSAKSWNGLEQAFSGIRDIYEFNHLTFLSVRNSGTGNSSPVYCTTYPEEWTAHYVVNDYFSVDPVVQVHKTDLLPVDWSSLDRTSKPIKNLFREANSLGVGRHGLTVPVRGPSGERSLFSATSDRSRREWTYLKTRSKPDLILISHYMHERFVDVLEARNHDFRHLSRRERQCLQMLAQGVVPKRIASSLHLSESAVRLYISTARRKLRAATVYQAIARATCCDMIDI
jgi:DNA-binding CsgD family transcriptional regulator